MASAPLPTALTVHQQSRLLEVAFDDGARFRIPFELMRIYSPSAEVQGHGPGQEVLQTGKRDVGIDALEPVGHYAVQPTFSDGHSSVAYLSDHGPAGELGPGADGVGPYHEAAMTLCAGVDLLIHDALSQSSKRS